MLGAVGLVSWEKEAASKLAPYNPRFHLQVSRGLECEIALLWFLRLPTFPYTL